MSLQAGREWTVYERDAEVEPHWDPSLNLL